MAKFDDQLFVCIDCESTGLKPKEDKIIEVAIATFTVNGIVSQYESLINPGCPIPAESIAIHHITDLMVAEQPAIASVLPQVLNLLSPHLIIVGHGISFDIELIASAADRAGIKHDLNKNKTLDTLRMARLYGKSPTNSLEQLRKHFSIEPEGAHRAMSDVIVNISVFLNLIKDYKNLDHLYAALEKPIQMQTMPLGKYKGRLVKELPIDYLRWAAHQSFDRDLLFTLRSEIKRRKNGQLFGQQANPFSQL